LGNFHHGLISNFPLRILLSRISKNREIENTQHKNYSGKLQTGEKPLSLSKDNQRKIHYVKIVTTTLSVIFLSPKTQIHSALNKLYSFSHKQVYLQRTLFTGIGHMIPIRTTLIYKALPIPTLEEPNAPPNELHA